ncbi:MAG: hypothetical protein ACO1OB_06845 [Archangium sp.]
MLFRAALVLVALCATGCVSLRDASLISTRVSVETFNAPVKCGPVGFRRTPLESRFGEYVRVTVLSSVPLKGTVLVHADGVAQEPKEWVSSVENPLVVDARFENDDPDRLVMLNQDRPIDITITGLEALEGGTCEGAIFTLEHGSLVPPVSDNAWLAELERRGGPELLARRQARLALEEERRLAHYAEWEAKDLNDFTVEELALMEERRLAHYAAWDAERNPVVEEEETAIASADDWNEYEGSDSAVVAAARESGVNAPPAQVSVGVQTTTDLCPNGVCETQSAPPSEGAALGGAVAASSSSNGCPGGVCSADSSELVLPAGCGSLSCAVPEAECDGTCISVNVACPGGVCGELMLPVGCGSIACAVPEAACGAGCVAASIALALPAGCGSMSCAQPVASCGGNCTPAATACPGGVCAELALPAGCGSMACAVPASTCTGGCTAARVACPNGTCAPLMMPAGCTSSACAVPATVCRGACTPCAGAQVTESWASYPAASGGGGNVAGGGVAGRADEWAMPPQQTTDVAWQQPYPVTTGPAPMPPPRPCTMCGPPPEVDVALDLGFLLPAMFGVVFGPPPPVVVGPPRPMGPPRVGPPPPRPHGAVPVR